MYCKYCGAKQELSKTIHRYDSASGKVTHDIDIYKCPNDFTSCFIVSDYVAQKHYPISPTKFFSEEWDGKWFELLPDKEQ